MRSQLVALIKISIKTYLYFQNRHPCCFTVPGENEIINRGEKNKVTHTFRCVDYCCLHGVAIKPIKG